MSFHWIGFCLAALAQAAAFAQTPQPPAPPTPPEPLPFRTVSEALAFLESKDGSETIVTHADGWVVVNQPAAAAQWSFTPSGHYAYPAVVRRTLKRGPDGAVAVSISSICEAPADACAKLHAEFSALNDRVTQAVQSSNRQPPRRP